MTEFDASAPIRRVVTGQDESGKSIIASDTSVPPIVAPLLPATAFFNLWGADAMPSLPDAGAEPSYRTWFPPVGGFRFELIALPPDGTPQPTDENPAEALAETNRILPGLMQAMDPAHPGWHSTDTSGACVLKLDGGETAQLETGDVLIQAHAMLWAILATSLAGS
jgi:hypothetical protein